MNFIWIILLVLAGYSFIVYFVLRLIVPFFGYGGFKMPAEIPQEIKQKISELEGRSASQNEYLKAAYDFIIGRWNLSRGTTILYAARAFRSNILKIWNSPGYAHCTTQNYILFLLLAGSRYFKPEDIKTKVVVFNFFIHQYLKVKVRDTWVDTDPAGAGIRGEPLGRHIEWFG